jgi:hypothetical protein
VERCQRGPMDDGQVHGRGSPPRWLIGRETAIVSPVDPR